MDSPALSFINRVYYLIKAAFLAALAGKDVTTSEDDLWQPVMDRRIRAVMPMAPGGAWLYNERGQAATNRPMLLIVSENDEFTPMKDEFAYLYD